MNKYGVILIGGTIGSVIASCNCSSKGDKSNLGNKISETDFVCKAFGIKVEDIAFDKKFIDDSNIIDDEEKKQNKISELCEFYDLVAEEQYKLGESKKYTITFVKNRYIGENYIQNLHYWIVKSNIKINNNLLLKIEDSDVSKNLTTGYYRITEHKKKNRKNLIETFYFKKK